jgi:hypothetical protein
MADTASLVWGLIFGTIGLGFFVYGTKQKAVIPFLSGFGLMAVPYFVSNVYLLVFICLILLVLPYFVRI